VARRLRIEWLPGRKITAELAVPGDRSGPAILLAHGAGAGQAHPFLWGLRKRLATAGFPTLTFDYPYMEAGRRAPDRLVTLLACHRAALQRLRSYGWPVVLAGKSILGLVFYGYPLVSPSSGVVRSTDHLRDGGLPMLFLAGSRDRLGPLDALRPLVERLPSAALEVIDEGDHSFKVPKRTGLSADDVLDRLAGLTIEWIRGL